MESISALATLGAASDTRSSGATANFASWVTSQIHDLNQSAALAESSAAKVVAGDIENLHQVMSQLSATELKFQLAVQIRDRSLEAYQEMLRMQL